MKRLLIDTQLFNNCAMYIIHICTTTMSSEEIHIISNDGALRIRKNAWECHTRVNPCCRIFDRGLVDHIDITSWTVTSPKEVNVVANDFYLSKGKITWE